MKKEFKYVLGILSVATNDPGACLMRVREDGEYDYVAIGEERLSRQKYDYVFPLFAIDYCMRHYGLDHASQIDLVVSDWVRLPRFEFSGPTYNVKEYDYLKSLFSIDRSKVHLVNHHYAHACSAYYSSPFEDAAVLVVDGNGSALETNSFLGARGNRIEDIDKHHYYGIGTCYTAVTTQVLNFGSGGEGKTMGLAPFGEKHPPVLDMHPEYGGVHTDYSGFIRRLPFSDVLNQVDEANVIYPFREKYRKRRPDEDPLDPYFSRAAFEVQDETERVIVHLANELYKKFPSRNICLSGGVMLNCVTNSLVLERTPFEKVSLFPACGDVGVTVGLCLAAYYDHPMFKDVPKRRKVLKNAYTGREYSDNEVTTTLDRYGVPSTPSGPVEVAGLLAEGKVVAWFDGGSEFGPRALGHRSILADSRGHDIKDIVNDKVKHREMWRPFAPAVLDEKRSEVFDLETSSPFMLLVGNAHRPDEIPSVVHVDGTARIQTATREDNGDYYEVIRHFDELTGVPVVMNTSFNVAGEPIVETPRDALICALGTGMDYVYLQGRLVDARLEGREALRDRMLADREAERASLRKDILERNYPGYDEAEKQAFVQRHNEMAIWWARNRAKYELEKNISQWIADGARVAVVGCPGHTRYLRAYVNQFNRLDVIGFVPVGSSAVSGGCGYEMLDWDGLRAVDPDVIVVSTHNDQFAVVRELEAVGLGKKAYLVYDQNGRSFEFLFPEPGAGE